MSNFLEKKLSQDIFYHYDNINLEIYSFKGNRT